MNARRSRASFATALLPIAALPLLMQAGTANAADPMTEACIKAFVSTTVQPEQPLKVRRVDSLNGPLVRATRNRPVTLTATVHGSSKPLAVATCTRSGSEVVLTMEGKPESRHLAQLSSR